MHITAHGNPHKPESNDTQLVEDALVAPSAIQTLAGQTLVLDDAHYDFTPQQVNVLRVVALCIVVTIDYELLNFQHDYTFQVVVYGCVLLLWYIWVKRFAPLPTLH